MLIAIIVVAAIIAIWLINKLFARIRPALYVRVCNDCGCVVSDPSGQLSGYVSNSWCPKCRSSWMTYRRATALEHFKTTFHLMPVYRPGK